MANGSELQVTVRHLVEQAVRGLPQMFNPGAGLFCYKMKKAPGGALVQEGTSARYTVMTLMGLRRLEQQGMRSPVDLMPVFERLLTNTEWVENIGDLGLLLWLVAEVEPDRLDEVVSKVQVSTALSRFSDARKGVTMHLAWFLTGLSCYSLACANPAQVRDLAREAYSLLSRNQARHGYFGHLAVRGSLQGRVRGWMGSFADQVYPIYGMAKYSEAFGDDSALRRASECARAICEAQGPLGQWWWHYDSGAGRVFEEYPVFSVHQHGMGPMTLLALGRVTGTDFNPWVYKGLEWIDRRNELSVSMEDASAGVIWRCIRQSPTKRLSGKLLGRRSNGRAPDDLAVLFECRPYELGWLLYGLVDLLN
jgi:hypothetical protein